MKKFIFIIILLFFISCDDTTKENLCENFSCKENEKCIINSEKPSCICDDGFHEENTVCIKNIVDICLPNPCNENNKTICEKNNDSYICKCDNGYVKENNICKKEVLENFKFRIMASNLTSGIYQDYEEYGIRILQALKPDIVMIQEFNYDLNEDNTTSKEELDLFISKTFGKDFNYIRGKEITIEDGDIPIPNGIISRYPIKDYGSWSDNLAVNRNFSWARIDIPGDNDLWVVSLHLKAGSSYASRRNNEIKQLLTHLSNIPNNDYIVIGGDLNTKDRDESAIKALSNLFNTSAPYPVGEAGKDGTNSSRRNPYDWVIADKKLAKFHISSDFCSDETNCKRYSDGLVFDSKKYDSFDLSIYFSPVELNDSRAASMQHMGVVKDFEITYNK